jgi:UDP-N-acetylmuramoyl-tripeptide--D-alanyl-D-alanine ligase
MRLAELAQLCEANLLRGDPQKLVEQISIDSRSLTHGACFVALRGPRFDGHQFVVDAAQRGASAAVVSDPTCAMHSPSALALLQVQDTLTALHKLATNYRRLMPPTTRIVAVTGSSGKTTTKQMIAAVLSQHFNVEKTKGNLNNHIGVPLSLMRVLPEYEVGVLELGTNHPGEIAMLADIVRPHVGVITNIGLAHVEFLSDEAGVAKEKGALLEVLPNNGDGLAVLNADDKWCSDLRARTRATVITTGIEKFADVRASDIKIFADTSAGAGIKFRLNIAKKREDVIVRLRTLGRHQVYNALQAAAVGYGMGLDLDEIRLGLEGVELLPMRMEQITVGRIRFINDCYNANLPSMCAALEMMRETPCAGRKIAVLGEIHELGAWAKPAHAEVGRLAAQCGLAFLVTVGAAARWIAEEAVAEGMEGHRVLTVANAAEAAETLRSLTREDDFVLIKGSRKLALEKILEAYGAGEEKNP